MRVSKLVFILLYIFHLPSLAIAYVNHFLVKGLTNNIPAIYTIEIITTWTNYLLILLFAIILNKRIAKKKKTFLAFLYVLYLFFIIAIEYITNSPLNLTQPIPIMSLISSL